MVIKAGQNILRRTNRFINDWLLTPEPNAAGNIGLFRIIFALYYFWHLTDFTPGNLYELPLEIQNRVVLIRWLPEEMPLLFFLSLEWALVGALVLLLVGCQTRFATFAVGATGGLLEAYFASADPERSVVFLVAYIPLFMLLVGDWGATYSLDAVLRRRAEESTVKPSDTAPRFVLPIRSVLLVLAALFVGSGLFKFYNWEYYFAQDHFLGHLSLRQRIEAAYRGLPLNPMAIPTYKYEFIDAFGRWGVALFESTFFMVLINRKWRAIYMSTALIFHCVNALLLLVTFTDILIVYGLFINWEAGLKRIKTPNLPVFQFRSGILIAGTLTATILAPFLWSETRIIHNIVTFGGLMGPLEIWIPVVPLSFAWWCYAVYDLTRTYGPGKRNPRRNALAS